MMENATVPGQSQNDTMHITTAVDEQRNDRLWGFLKHMYKECQRRYTNLSLALKNRTEFNKLFVSDIPEFSDEIGNSINIAEVDQAAAERDELLATVSSVHDKNGFNFSEIVYCPFEFDGYLCWPPTSAGTVLSQYCPDFIEGFNSKLLAHKTCLENGSWYRHPESGRIWSNYTNCIDYHDLEFRSFVNELYVKGYGLSLIALVLSLTIFLGFKSLRCTRIRIHVHLFASLAFTCISWIFWYKFVVENPENLRDNPLWCIALHLVVHYFMLANYFWMFCEGLHLHLVLVVVFVKDTVVMRWFMFLAWVSPILFLSGYTLARYYHPTDNAHCWMEDSELLWILSLPICVSLMSSFVFLINVLRVIVRKLHPQSAQPAPLAIRKAVRATIILIPLFGLQHFLLPYRPDNGTPLERFYQILSVILVSLQGFVVSFLFCFANHDVVFATRSFLSRAIPTLVSPPTAGSNTGQMATTTPSRELGV